ncbi:phage shock protein PspA [Algicola sagamiensis]|uniref:phage shock protein PspA n=1 Tax=Algicola sagamiensis TaxID=163869 RepID=UPI00036F7C7B|nr:phage shock protein PspA [Algicola sagamiensis]
MGIFSRFTDIVNSNINAILDKAEDPQKMVRLIIQEMEDTLVEVRSASAKAIAERKELERREQRLQADAEQWQNKATLALSKDREDLARAALMEKQKATQSFEALQKELERVDDHIAKLSEEIHALQEKLADAKARQSAMLLRQQTASTRLDAKKQLTATKTQDALLKFEQYERKIDHLEAEVESHDLGKKSLSDEIAELESQDQVDQELAELKKQLKDK